MPLADKEYNRALKAFFAQKPAARRMFMERFLSMPAVSQMLRYLYQIARRTEISRNEIYEGFFKTPFVQQFCEQEGIDEVTDEASRRRCPFLLSILDAFGVVQLGRDSVTVTKLLVAATLVRSHRRESIEEAEARAKVLVTAWPCNEQMLQPNDVSILRELFGSNFLTPKYHLKDLEYIER